MKFLAAIILAGAVAAAPAFFFRRPSCAEAYERTPVTVDLENSTLRTLFRELERRTGFPVRDRCCCGALQRVVDRPDLTFRVHDLAASKALLLVTPRLDAHCGGWSFEEDGVSLRCGRSRIRE